MKRILKSSKGLTMVEVVASIALLGFAAILFVSFFTVSFRLLGKANETSSSSLENAGSVEENSSAPTGSGDDISIDFGSTEITVYGEYVNDGDGQYSRFVPGS